MLLDSKIKVNDNSIFDLENTYQLVKQLEELKSSKNAVMRDKMYLSNTQHAGRVNNSIFSFKFMNSKNCHHGSYCNTTFVNVNTNTKPSSYMNLKQRSKSRSSKRKKLNRHNKVGLLIFVECKFLI